jgi:hypothetical protein
MLPGEFMAKKNMVVCGDSYNVGIGLKKMLTSRYSQLVCDQLDWDLTMLARGSASNYAIHLQAKYAATLENIPNLVVISITSFDRIEWLEDGASCPYEITLNNLNYHLYPPHFLPQPHHDVLSFHLKDDPKYNPILLTEQITAFKDYFDNFKNKNSIYYRRLFTESDDKLQLIKEYYTQIWEHPIKRDYDLGLISKSYYTLKKLGINCIILSSAKNVPMVYDFIPSEDIVDVDWGELSHLYPDSIGSYHCDETAHKIIAEKLYDRILKNGYDL